MRNYRNYLKQLIEISRGERDYDIGMRNHIEYDLVHKSINLTEYEKLISMLDEIENDMDE